MTDQTLAITPAPEPGRSAVWNVQLRGELDISTADHLEQALADLEARGAAVVVLDLRDVTFLDSSGLRAIVRAQHGMSERERTLLVDGLSPAASRVLELTGLLEGLTRPAADRP